MSSPCHIELILSEKEEPVKKEVMIDHLSDNIILTSSFLLHQILIYCCSCRLRLNWQQARRRALFEVVLHLKLPLKLLDDLHSWFMSVLSIVFLYICYELLLKLGQHLLLGILCFKLIELLGNFYYGNWMINFSFNSVDPCCWEFTEVESCSEDASFRHWRAIGLT